MSTDIDIRISRVDLIDKLEARRDEFRQIDAERIAKHKKAEATALAVFRQRCREALKWTWPELKEHGHAVSLKSGYRGSGEVPECPRSLERQLDDGLRVLRASTQNTYTLSPNGHNARIHFMLTHDPRQTPEVC